MSPANKQEATSSGQQSPSPVNVSTGPGLLSPWELGNTSGVKTAPANSAAKPCSWTSCMAGGFFAALFDFPKTVPKSMDGRGDSPWPSQHMKQWTIFHLSLTSHCREEAAKIDFLVSWAPVRIAEMPPTAEVPRKHPVLSKAPALEASPRVSPKGPSRPCSTWEASRWPHFLCGFQVKASWPFSEIEKGGSFSHYGKHFPVSLLSLFVPCQGTARKEGAGGQQDTHWGRLQSVNACPGRM